MTTSLLSAKLQDSEPLMRCAKSGLHFLWATPRSVSTAFGRCMASHPDVTLIHEPFTDTYYFGPERKSARYGDLLQPASAGGCAAEAVNDRLRKAGLANTVFIKELAFQGEPFIDDDIIAQATHTLIVRRPAVVASSLKKLKPDFSEDEFGFRAADRIWKRCLRAGKHVMVVDGDHFRAEPCAILTEVCMRIGVVFNTSMLAWENGAIKQWEPHERESQAKWHRTLEDSKTILPPAPLQPDPLADLTPIQRKIVEHSERLYQDMRRNGAQCPALELTAD
jgi:hypothetical protein